MLEAHNFLRYFTSNPVHVETFILANLFKYKLGPATHHKFWRRRLLHFSSRSTIELGNENLDRISNQNYDLVQAALLKILQKSQKYGKLWSVNKIWK